MYKLYKSEDKAKFEQVKNTQETKHKKELIDISEDLTFLKKVEPIYKTIIIYELLSLL